MKIIYFLIILITATISDSIGYDLCPNTQDGTTAITGLASGSVSLDDGSGGTIVGDIGSIISQVAWSSTRYCDTTLPNPPNYISNGYFYQLFMDTRSTETGDCGYGNPYYIIMVNKYNWTETGCEEDPEPDHCTDGVKSGDESGIDCGGSCGAPCVELCPQGWNLINGTCYSEEIPMKDDGTCPSGTTIYGHIDQVCIKSINAIDAKSDYQVPDEDYGYDPDDTIDRTTETDETTTKTYEDNGDGTTTVTTTTIKTVVTSTGDTYNYYTTNITVIDNSTGDTISETENKTEESEETKSEEDPGEDYIGILEQIRDNVQDVENDLTTVNNNLSSIDTKLYNVETGIDEVVTAVDQNTNAVSDVEISVDQNTTAVNSVKSAVDANTTAQNETTNAINTMSQDVQTGLTGVQTSVDGLNAPLEGIGNAVNAMGGKIDELGNAIDEGLSTEDTLENYPDPDITIGEDEYPDEENISSLIQGFIDNSPLNAYISSADIVLDTPDPCLYFSYNDSTVDMCFDHPQLLSAYSIWRGVLIGIAYIGGFFYLVRRGD